VIAKVSRVEVAAQFFSPPPEKLLTELVQMNKITEQEAQLAEKIPVSRKSIADTLPTWQSICFTAQQA
jgi:hypothetical protein